jgi:methylmalonyl-CoA mutase N-terminal domain/subunit
MDDRTTPSWIPVKPHYGPEDLPPDLARDAPPPGVFPFARGIFPLGYRGSPWMESLASGYGLPEDTNRREQYLQRLGQAAYGGRRSINLVLDRPTFCGLDSDDPRAAHEVGVVGVAIDSVEDFGRLLEGFDPAELSLGLIADRVGPVLLAMYVAHADAAGVPHERLRGIVCNNPLTDFYSSKTPMFPPRDCVRVMVDCIRFCLAELPQMNALRIGAYNTRESGSTAVQEVAYNLAIAADVLHAAVTAGVPAGEVAARVNFQFSQGPHLFEEVAKIRAARRMWARLLRERFGVLDDRACRMKIHAQTAGVSLTAQEPLNNVARVALQVLTAALSGVQSVHVASYDEALGIPTEEAVRVAVKTSKIVMHETGVADVADPLGGAYYVEALTAALEAQAWAAFEDVERRGGAVAAIESGYIEREIAHAAGRYYVEVERGERVVVGVNRFVEPEGAPPVPVFRPDPRVAAVAAERLARLRATRDARRHRAALEAVRTAAREGGPLMPRLVEAAAARATLGELMGSLTEVFGEFPLHAIVAG